MAYETYNCQEFIGEVMKETKFKAVKKMVKVRIKYSRRINTKNELESNCIGKYEPIYINKIRLLWDKNKHKPVVKIKYTTKDCDKKKVDVIELPHYFSVEFNY